MFIDFIFAIIILVACFKGFRKGLIIALFSMLALIIGLAAALKLSAVVSEYLSSSTGATGKWLPFLSFILVFAAVVILVNLGAKLIQKSVEMVLLGWVNRLGGIIFYLLLYGIIFSIVLFYLVQLKVISDETIVKSISYPFIKPLGPFVIDKLGEVIPLFKNLFGQLQTFFENLATQPKP